MAAELHRRLNQNALINSKTTQAIVVGSSSTNHQSVPLVGLYHSRLTTTSHTSIQKNTHTIEPPLDSATFKPSRLCYIKEDIIAFISRCTLYIIELQRDSTVDTQMKGRNGYNVSAPLPLNYNIIEKYTFGTLLYHAELNCITCALSNSLCQFYIVDSSGCAHLVNYDINTVSTQPPSKQRKIDQHNKSTSSIQYIQLYNNTLYTELGPTAINQSTLSHKFYVSSMFSNTVQLYDVSTSAPINIMYTQHSPLAIDVIQIDSASSHELLALAQNNVLSLYDTRMSNEQCIIDLQHNYCNTNASIHCIDHTRSSSPLIATGASDRNVNIYDVRTSKVAHIMQNVTKHQINYVRFSALTDKQLYVADDNELLCTSYISSNTSTSSNERIAFRGEGCWGGIDQSIENDTIYAITNTAHLYNFHQPYYFAAQPMNDFINPVATRPSTQQHKSHNQKTDTDNMDKQQIIANRLQKKEESKLLKTNKMQNKTIRIERMKQ